jgi:prolyl-tRNA editing enzyme YbaK/EbsC (Cys-tRNA(Pro) deacylase)
MRRTMTVESVRRFFQERQEPVHIIELPVSTATVALAAQAHGVEPGRIAKTLAFRLADGSQVLLVARGDARIDNRKFKDVFGKGKMLPPDEVADITGHPVGGVCPFGLARALPVCLDVSLQAYDEVQRTALDRLFQRGRRGCPDGDRAGPRQRSGVEEARSHLRPDRWRAGRARRRPSGLDVRTDRNVGH